MGLKKNCQEAFCQDSDLVQVTRRRYFEAHYPTFNQEGSHNLSGLLWEIVACADLLDSEIYKIQEVWTSQRDLWYANDVLKSSPKGLQFFCPVSPLELPKVMGLQGIHHPEALCHHTGLSYCPWCRKEVHNEETVYYKLGLICSRCLPCPVISGQPFTHDRSNKIDDQMPTLKIY